MRFKLFGEKKTDGDDGVRNFVNICGSASHERGGSDFEKYVQLC